MSLAFIKTPPRDTNLELPRINPLGLQVRPGGGAGGQGGSSELPGQAGRNVISVWPLESLGWISAWFSSSLCLALRPLLCGSGPFQGYHRRWIVLMGQDVLPLLFQTHRSLLFCAQSCTVLWEVRPASIRRSAYLNELLRHFLSLPMPFLSP